jgi:glutamine synthetase
VSGAEPVLARLEELGADFLWIVYHDYSGIGRAKAVTGERLADAIEHGVTWAKANWNIAVDDHLIPHPGFAADSGDFVARPDPATLTPVPYRPRVALALSDLVDDLGAAWNGDPRARLKAQVEALAAVGLEARVAFEVEFLLAEPVGDRTWRPADRGRMFVVDEIEARWDWVADLLDTLAAMDIPVHQFAREYGNGQYELSLLPADPLAAVDSYVIARQAVKALARDAGLVASFMPKPFAELPGNGLHVHLSLSRPDGGDALTATDDVGALSPLGLAAVAGLLEHAPGQAALGAATPNSYKRLLPGSWAPAHVCWAVGNRAALVRVPGRGVNRRLEYRSGDGSASPYLHLAGLLAAIVDGVQRELSAPEPVVGDVGHLTDREAAAQGAVRLPGSLGEALDALERDDVLRAMLGPTIDEHYRAVKRYELTAYEHGAGALADPTEVTEWERLTYLEPL